MSSIQILDDRDLTVLPTSTSQMSNEGSDKTQGNFGLDEHVGKHNVEKSLQGSSMSLQQLVKTLVWHGGSSADAWLNAVAAQVGQVILSMPYSYSQMGMKLGIIFHLVYITFGCWASYLIACLYLEYRSRKEKEGVNFRKHTIQYHEVMGFLIGPWLQHVTLFFNIVSVGAIAAIQIIACGSNAYYLNPHIDKRNWTFIFGALATITVLLPSFHNFRIWSIIGVLTTTYTAWYMVTASLIHGQEPGVKHSAPQNMQQFFTGTSNILYAFGGHAITMEIMHAMWKPHQYKYVYVLTCAYVLTITMPHSIAMYWAFGDELLTKSNAFAVLPKSAARDTGLIFMLIHTCISFAAFVMPLFFLWEKLLGLHQARFLVRTIVRLPVVLFLWFLALMVPFFGPLNSLIGSLLLSFSTYVIPCVAYLYVFRTKQARQGAADKPPKWIPGWSSIVIISSLVISIVLTLGVGLGSWASVSNIVHQVHTFGLFGKCYQCT